MLHITNGESAASGLRAAGVPGPVLSWNDVLYDGPVPGDISFNQLRAVRARFIADCGWRSFDEAAREFADRDRALEASLQHEEVVLWFEHDLFDQLQLLQLLDWFATCELGATKLTLVCDAEYLGPSAPERLAARFPERRAVTDSQLQLARAAWAAYRDADPSALQEFIASDSAALPFVRAALTRHLQQYPSTTNGLSRTEQQALGALALGAATVGDAFVAAHQNAEEALFLGDSSFAMYLAALGTARHPLVVTVNDQPIKGQVAGSARALWQSPLHLTDVGKAVLANRADHIRLNGIDRWYGGVHLNGEQTHWRWDAGAGQLRRMALNA
jgi:hypothetical protein